MARIHDWLAFEFKDAEALGVELQATDKQVRAALSRAAQRTASALRRRASRALASELELRAVSLIRNRLKAGRVRGVAARGDQFGGGARLWFGLNPMPVQWFKGRPTKTPGGAQHRGTEFKGAFVGRSALGRRRVTIFRRRAGERLPIHEETIEVSDKMQVYIEDEIMAEASDLFWQAFERDLRARVKYKLGRA